MSIAEQPPLAPQARTLAEPATAWGAAAVAAVLALAGLVAVYFETGRSMVEIWWDLDTYAHGFLIAPISAYLVWTRREELRGIAPRPALLALPLLGMVAMAWLLAEQADVQVVEQFAFVGMVPLVVWAVLGTRVAWALAFPLAYLLFSVPTGEFLTEPMMDYTGKATVLALEWTGIPVYSEGRHITIPTGNWEIAEACSGVRYLIASVAVGCVYAYLTYRSLWRRLAFIALSFAVPVVANWARAYGIVMIGHLSDMRLAVGVDHIIYGWLFFGLVMFVLFWIGSFWQDRPRAGDVARPAAGSAGRPAGTLALWSAGLAALLIAAAAPLASRALEQAATAAPAAAMRIALPAGQGGWEGPGEAAESWAPTFPGASQLLHRVYRRDGRVAHVYVVHYQREGQGQELIGWNSRLFEESWRHLGRSRGSVALADGRRPVDEQLLGSATQKRVVWRWYEIGGRFTADERVGKLLGAWARVTRDPHGSALVAVAASYESRPEEGRETLSQLLRDLPDLARALPRLPAGPALP
jgi:exosortase A